MVQAALIDVGSDPVRLQALPAARARRTAAARCLRGGLGAFSNALAIASRKREWMFWAVQQSLLFPLLILSGMMLPLEAGPRWIQVVGAFNPLTYIVNAERALFAGSFTARRSVGRPGRGPDLRRRALGRRQPGGPQYDLIMNVAEPVEGA